MSIAETVYRGLMADRRLISQLHRDCRGRCIYHGRSPDAGSYATPTITAKAIYRLSDGLSYTKADEESGFTEAADWYASV